MKNVFLFRIFDITICALIGATILSPLREVQFDQTLRYFEISTSSFTRVNSGVKISKSLDFDQIYTFRNGLNDIYLDG